MTQPENISNNTNHNKPGHRSTFLDAIARGYIDRYRDLSEICFVFPAKRAGTFFLRSLTENTGSRTLLAPDIKAMTDFMQTVSGYIPDSRIDMLLRLYSLYREIVSGNDELDPLDFEKFRSWGETLLNDFSEVDQYLVDTHSLFKNVKDYKEISSTFLTDEQLRIMETYFNYKRAEGEVESFWKNFEDSDAVDSSKIKKSFLMLWQLMEELYNRLTSSLAAEGLCMPGAAWRISYEKVTENGTENLPWKKVVFVGFNALATSEAAIFEKLSSEKSLIAGDDTPYADFIWDDAGPTDPSESNNLSSPHLHEIYIKANKRNFKSPEWLEPYLKKCRAYGLKGHITTIAAPSNSAQAKIAALRIDRMARVLPKSELDNARVAVVLPDESLLAPLISALPPALDNVNLTMGFPIRSASIITFIYHLRRLQLRRRRIGTDTGFYHLDLKLFLSHPYSHNILGSDVISKINGYIDAHHKFTVSMEELKGILVKGAEILSPLPFDMPWQHTIRYIEDILDCIESNLHSTVTDTSDETDSANADIRNRLEKAQIILYRDAVRRLQQALLSNKIKVSPEGVLSLIDTLISGETIAFEGEPLQGLQVMGMLETRALDFDHIIIPSLNDKILPARSRKRTFIPDSLRHGYGMVSAYHQETLMAYYFYRLLARARSVTLIYDARAGEGMRSGGRSRYLHQLEHLYAKDRINKVSYRFMLFDNQSSPKPIEKSESIIGTLERFRTPDSGYNFSATALKKYMSCGIRFYYEVVKNIRTDNPASDYMDAATQGTILHDTMVNLYFPAKTQRILLHRPITIDEEHINRLLDDPDTIKALLRRSINKHYFRRNEQDLDAPLFGTAQITADMLYGDVRKILNYDLTIAPFDLYGGELADNIQWDVAGLGKINMRFAIDRVDRPGNSSVWRIVDYKTGGAHVEASNFENIFNAETAAGNIFQLMLYANLLNAKMEEHKNFHPMIYCINDLNSHGPVTPKVERQLITDHVMINDRFVETLNNMLREIFDPTVPFKAPENDDACAYCTLQQLCGKLIRN